MLLFRDLGSSRTWGDSQPASITNLKSFQGGCAPPHLSRHFNIPCRRRLCHKASDVQRRCAVCAQRHAPQPQDPRPLQAQLCSAMQLMKLLQIQCSTAPACAPATGAIHTFILQSGGESLIFHAIRTEFDAPQLRHPRSLQTQLYSAMQVTALVVAQQPKSPGHAPAAVPL